MWVLFAEANLTDTPIQHNSRLSVYMQFPAATQPTQRYVVVNLFDTRPIIRV